MDMWLYLRKVGVIPELPTAEPCHRKRPLCLWGNYSCSSGLCILVSFDTSLEGTTEYHAAGGNDEGLKLYLLALTWLSPEGRRAVAHHFQNHLDSEKKSQVPMLRRVGRLLLATNQSHPDHGLKQAALLPCLLLAWEIKTRRAPAMGRHRSGTSAVKDLFTKLSLLEPTSCPHRIAKKYP
jgi:hypothetical protein